VDGGTISIQSVTQPANGTVVITNAGADLTYQPNANYCNAPPGTTLETFTYTLAPGGSAATVRVTVTCVDEAPTAVADAATVGEDSGANAIDVLANDTDPDGGPISVVSVTQPANGTVVITGGGTGLTYAPNANYCNNPPGTTLDTFTYTLTPGGSSATVSVTVTCVDDPPVAVADAATVNEDSGANSINVLANDTDIDAGAISIASVTQPANGTVAITNGGADLTYTPNLNYCNNGSPLDTFTYTLTPGGSSTTVSVTVNCVNDPPVAGADAYDFIGNTELRVDLAATTATPHVLKTTASGLGVLHNDSDPVENDPIAVVGIVGCADLTAPFVCPIGGLGTVTMEANGAFSFVPEPGDAGATEVFQYILSDGTDTAHGTVTLTRYERVWYVDNSASPGGNGTSTQPFNAITPANLNDNDSDGALTGDLDGPGDYIFVYFGDGTPTGMSGGLFLESGQHLIGEHAGLSLPVNLNGNGAPTLLITAVPGRRPLLHDTVADGFDGVAARNVVPASIVGMNLAGIVNAIDWTTTAAFAGSGTFTIRDNVIRSAAVEGVDINLAGSGAVNLAFHDNTITSTGTALDIQRTGSGSLTITAFNDNVVTGDTGGAGMIVNGAIFDAVPGGILNPVSGGTTLIGVSGNPVAGLGLELSNATGAIEFADLDIYAGLAGVSIAGTGSFTGTAGTRVAVVPSMATIQAGNGPGVSATGATIDLRLNSLVVTASPTTGVSLVNISDATVSPTAAHFSAGSGSSIANTSGAAFSVNGGNGTISYGGSITNALGRSVQVENRTGDSVTLTSGSTVNDTGSGILLNSNSISSVVEFLGTLTLNTGTNAAFTATNGGTLRVQGAANTIATSTGVGLNITGTTIGTGSGAPETGLRFRSISAGTGASGPSSGIVLSNTGTNGSLTVTGTGSAASGGAIQRTTGPGISLATTLSPSFTNVSILNTAGSGVQGTAVTNFSFVNGSIDNSGTGLAPGTSNIAFNAAAAGTENNLSGAVTITGNSLTNAYYHGVDILNYNGTVSNAVISGNTLTSNPSVASSQGSAIRLIAFGSGSTAAHVTAATIANNTIRNFPAGDGIQVQGGNASAGGPATTMGTSGSATNIIAITGNSIAGQSAVNKLGGNGIVTSLRGSGQGSFNVSGNGSAADRLRDLAGIGIAVSIMGPISATATIDSNYVMPNNTFGSQGILAGIDSHFATTDAGSLTATITNNTVSQTDGNGIHALARNSNATLRTKIQNNTVAAPLGGVRPGIRLDSGSASGNTTLCLNISGNSSAGSGGHQGIGLRKQGTISATNTFGVNGMAATSSPAVEAYIDGLNPLGAGTLLLSATSGFTNCSLP
jgi:hypothetical protein